MTFPETSVHREKKKRMIIGRVLEVAVIVCMDTCIFILLPAILTMLRWPYWPACDSELGQPRDENVGLRLP